MAQRKNLQINSIEFDGIKSNIRTFLKGQETFRDYDFEGAGLSVLIDLLAYNTYYQAFYNNVAINEMFLDSAVKRASVVSHAKNLGYTPNSKTAPTAIVDVTLSGSAPALLLPGAQFTATVNGRTFTFVNTKISTLFATAPHIRDLEIKEGRLSSTTYVVPDITPNRKYEIPDSSADISTITVRVQTSQTDTTGYTDVWSVAGDLTTISSSEKVYWIEENTRGTYEILFGDDVMGQKILAGNLITITYLITSGSAANGIGFDDSASNRIFKYGNASNIVEVKSIALGGGEKETISSIRFKAPRAYTTQNRAVTKGDYSSLVESNFTGVDSVFVYGGEEADPPSFGKVFIAVKPSTGSAVSDSFRKSIGDFLKTKAVLGITPEVVEPDYTFLRFFINVYYDESKTTLPKQGIATLVKSAVSQNLSQNIGKFEKTFSMSKLTKEIDNASYSIESSSVNVFMEKKILPSSQRPISYDIKYGNSIYHPHNSHSFVITSNVFSYLDPSDQTIKVVFIEDDGNGKLSFYTLEGQTKKVILDKAGTVDYARGRIKINQVQIFPPSTTPFIRILAEAKNQRYTSTNNMILFSEHETDSTAISITTTGVTESGVLSATSY